MQTCKSSSLSVISHIIDEEHSSHCQAMILQFNQSFSVVSTSTFVDTLYHMVADGGCCHVVDYLASQMSTAHHVHV